jgi:hypothetical protein
VQGDQLLCPAPGDHHRAQCASNMRQADGSDICTRTSARAISPAGGEGVVVRWPSVVQVA